MPAETRVCTTVHTQLLGNPQGLGLLDGVVRLLQILSFCISTPIPEQAPHSCLQTAQCCTPGQPGHTEASRIQTIVEIGETIGAPAVGTPGIASQRRLPPRRKYILLLSGETGGLTAAVLLAPCRTHCLSHNAPPAAVSQPPKALQLYASPPACTLCSSGLQLLWRGQGSMTHDSLQTDLNVLLNYRSTGCPDKI